MTSLKAQSWNSVRRVIIRLMFSLFKTNLKLKIAAAAFTYLRGGRQAGKEQGLSCKKNIHHQVSSVLASNMLLRDIKVAFVTCVMFLVLSIKCVLHLFLSGKQTEICFF